MNQPEPQFQFNLAPPQKIYFASDFHLGVPSYQESRRREDAILSWLDFVRQDAAAVFLLGDLFDFWFEYKYVVPKGFVRFLGKLASLRDQEIPVFLFTGNHDMWMFDYLKQELNVPIVRQPVSLLINGQLVHVGHGDGLGGGEQSFKFLKRVFQSPWSRKIFAAIHPRWGMGLAHRWSRQSRKNNLKRDESFQGKENELIYQYCRDKEKYQHHDYYIFGHRHLALQLSINEHSRYFNLGEWLRLQTYGIHDGSVFRLQTFEK